RASKVVSAATSFPVQYNKAIVGRNAFAHESGIHQDGVLKDASTYEIMRPEMVGLKQSSLVLGKHSGRHAFVHKLEEMGYKLGANQLEDAFTRMKALADRKKDIYDEDIEALVDEEMAASHDRIKLTSLTVIAGTHGPQRATMNLEIPGLVLTHHPGMTVEKRAALRRRVCIWGGGSLERFFAGQNVAYCVAATIANKPC